MRKLITIILFTLLIFSCSEEHTIVKADNQNDWSKIKRLEYLKNTTDSTTWDKELLEGDKQMIGLGDFGPFELGAFPVPRYELLGKESFKGVGSKLGEFQIKNKNLLMNSFFVAKNKMNENRLRSKKSEMFFQILILTDTIRDDNQSMILSRNHPDYLGQGFVKTKNNRIDYLAFQTLENNSYAIINTKIFDLNNGKTILVAPQKDRTLRFKQIEQENLIVSDSIADYTEELIIDKTTIEFFEQNGNI